MKSKNQAPNYLPYLWLALGGALQIFMGGKWNIPVVTWLGPVFLMRFFRTQDRWYKTLISLPVLAASMVLYIYKLAPFPPEIPLWFYLFLVLGYALLTAIPYMVDRAVCRTVHHPITVLVFPSVITVVHYLTSRFGPTGSAGVWGHNLFDFTSLLQVASITGVWGLSFLVGWFASTVNALWEEGFAITRVRVPVAAFSAVLCLVLLFGGIRLYLFKPAAETVKVGSVVVPWPEGDVDYGDEGNVFWDYVHLGTPAEEINRYRPLLQELQDELFAQSEGLVAADVKILMWSVGNVTLLQDDEPAFVQRAQAFAKEHQIYFFPSILTLKPGQYETENKVLAITPAGEVAYTYHKARPTPGEPLTYSDETLHTVDTPYGRIATAICYDMYFTDLVQQTGREGVDILLVPADEPTPELDPFDTEGAMFRGIENGCSVLRSTLEGLTMGVDYQGNVLSRMSFWTTKENRTTITHIPTRGERTFYAVAGDWFAYLSAVSTAGFCTWAVVEEIRQRRSQPI